MRSFLKKDCRCDILFKTKPVNFGNRLDACGFAWNALEAIQDFILGALKNLKWVLFYLPFRCI